MADYTKKDRAKIIPVHANRGFWNSLFHADVKKIEFIISGNKQNDNISQNSKSVMWNVSQWKIWNVLGIYQSVRVESDFADGFLSYNRFLKSNRSYALVLESPIALVHYQPGRARSLLGKRHLKRSFMDKNLRSIVCLNHACRDTLTKYYTIPNSIEVTQIYPYVKDSIADTAFERKIDSPVIHCLYVSSQFYLKGGAELVAAIEENKWDKNKRLHFDIITKLDSLEQQTLDKLRGLSNVSLYDFHFTKEELNAFYEKANILIHMTRMDSFPLTLLEALKYGCAFIAADVYAISEIVKNEYNGFVQEPPVRYWNADNTLNVRLKRKEKKRLYHNYVERSVVRFLSEKINDLLEDKNKLTEYQKNSLALSKTVFADEKTLEAWSDVLYRNKEG